MEFERNKKYKNAIELLEHTININPNSDELYHGLGDIYRLNNQLKLAIETFRKGLKVAEKNSHQALKNLFEEHIKETLKMLENK